MTESNVPSSSSQKKNKNKGTNPNVQEASRIRISQILETFRSSHDDVYTFESNLTNHERALVHEISRRMGLISKSSGRGLGRQVSIKKKTAVNEIKKAKGNFTSFTFSEESKDILGDLFTDYPPDDCGLVKKVARNSVTSSKIMKRTNDMFCRPKMNTAEIKKKVQLFASRVQESSKLKEVVEGRAKLPISSYRDMITSTVQSNQVVLICGETGCGKTTQVPQFILDSMWYRGETCKIVCSQPRRISVTSVSDRISFERGEDIGDTVGYKIRLESKGGRNSSIILCTNGILLRILVSEGACRSRSHRPTKLSGDNVSEITHIIVDEIHERDRYSDFMLPILRDMLPFYPHLRLVLMSATIDADRFSQYFGGCPIFKVPGFTHPVKSYYLEDVLVILNASSNNHLDYASSNDVIDMKTEYSASFDEAIDIAWSTNEFETLVEAISSESKFLNYQHSTTGMTPLMVLAGKGKVGAVCLFLSVGVDCSLQDSDGLNALEWARRENQEETAEIIRKHMENRSTSFVEEQKLLEKYVSTSNPDLIDFMLIEKLLRKICNEAEDGAILIFLPGWDDINKTRERLLNNTIFRDSSKFLILSLHSMVPPVEQKKAFKRPPSGCRKIILSTNISETAVTIDDIVYVIDSGRMKEKSYDPYNNVSTLQSSWISKASAKQREGRAGRCQPGICYHLYSKIRAASMLDFPVPEIKRIPIEELCLQVKLLDPSCRIAAFLEKTLDPPVSETIQNAILVLQDIGALSTDESLTQLGERLGSLPVHPLTSKMLFFSIMVKCLDPALTLACASDFRDPFTLPMLPDERKKATAARSELASLYGGSSDQLAVVAAYECWRNAKNKGLEAQFCSEYFVSSATMHMLSAMRKQLQIELVRFGFIRGDISSCNENTHDPGLLHSVIVAGLYPMVGRIIPAKNGKRSVVETASGDKILLHPQSTNMKFSIKKSNNDTLIMYDEITRGDGGMFIRNSSIISPLPLLLLATEMVAAPIDDDDVDDDAGGISGSDDEDDEIEMKNKAAELRGERIMSSPDNPVKIVIDRWLSFESTALDVAQLYCLRERLSAATVFIVENPHIGLPEFLRSSINAISRVLSLDGLSDVLLGQNSADQQLTSTASAHKNDPNKLESTKQAVKSSTEFLKSLLYSVPRNPKSRNSVTPAQRQTFPKKNKIKRGPHPTAHSGSGPRGPNPTAQSGTPNPTAQSGSGAYVVTRSISAKRQRDDSRPM
ncbi:DExH-box ATP-dependent RNA helicase DExH6 [Impatiens glandulifera]|uniref:DExH-box ATP-dependent RNA helicase DExH6 n=1 Tax=Impatiens glandulifera TaxID=253017 RepID=UPI001FB0ABA2|nr:DExH-box ATP-dependent RNA helicase DExH6 [Impatiens glandulifera]